MANFAVLIETSWNVKIEGKPEWMLRAGINRNIVECKAGQGCHSRTTGQRINRNIVECKGRNCTDHGENASCINRNIVECKVK